MAVLDIVYGPAPIFRQKSVVFTVIDDEARKVGEDLLETMYEYRGLGIAATMVGILKRVIVIDLQEEGVRMPYIFFNPEITWRSEALESREEASLSFPGISAHIERPNAIKVTYLDKKGNSKELEASAWFATVIQHEMEYLDGITYLDNLSKMKRDRLVKKMQKMMKHTHTHGCGDPDCDVDHEH